MNSNTETDYLLYHYCSQEAFHSIIANKELWLSDINYMNDPTELKWARDQFIKVLKENRELFSQEFRIIIINSVFNIDHHFLPLIACMSINGDLETQWKAYGDNGTGYSIGFSSKLMYEGLGVNIYPITYDISEQCKTILKQLIALQELWEKENRDSFFLYSTCFALDLNYLKNPNFIDEQEVRIVRVAVKDPTTNEFYDPGGNSEINKIVPNKILTRYRDRYKIKFIKLPLDIPKENIIKEIVIGPKSLISEIELRNKTLIGDDISIRKSNLLYE